jgi:hypothetical protein
VKLLEDNGLSLNFTNLFGDDSGLDKLSYCHFPERDYELTSWPFPEWPGVVAGWSQQIRTGRQLPAADQWWSCCRMNRWSRWDRRSCQTRRGTKYLPNYRRTGTSVQLTDARGSASFDSILDRDLPGWQKAPMTMAEVAMKVKSLTSIF